ncbi:MAG: thermonuclease family protein [Candidatus Muiribacteriaceae bacterium]
MKRLTILLAVFCMILSVYSADSPELKTMTLTLEEVRSHGAFVFEEIGYATLAGISKPRYEDSVFEEVKGIVSKKLDSMKDKNGKLKVRVHALERTYKDGRKRTYNYIIIEGKDGPSLNEFVIRKGICYLNKYAKDYYDIEKMKKLEDKAKEEKLYNWKD